MLAATAGAGLRALQYTADVMHDPFAFIFRANGEWCPPEGPNPGKLRPGSSSHKDWEPADAELSWHVLYNNGASSMWFSMGGPSIELCPGDCILASKAVFARHHHQAWVCPAPTCRLVIALYTGRELSERLAEAFETTLQQLGQLYGASVTPGLLAELKPLATIPYAVNGYELINKLPPAERHVLALKAVLTRFGAGITFGAGIAEQLGPDGRRGRASKMVATRAANGWGTDPAVEAMADATRTPATKAAIAAVAAGLLQPAVCKGVPALGRTCGAKWCKVKAPQWYNFKTLCPACYKARSRAIEKGQMAA